MSLLYIDLSNPSIMAYHLHAAMTQKRLRDEYISTSSQIGDCPYMAKTVGMGVLHTRAGSNTFDDMSEARRIKWIPEAYAASYAKLGWRSAWCKSHYPAEFMAAVQANWGGYYSQRVYPDEARRMGLSIRLPHVNYSAHNFIVKKLHASDELTLFMGLDQVKELTNQTIQQIIRWAPFTSVDDFLTRVDPRAQEAENLACVGALDGLGKIPLILRRLQNGGWQQNQMSPSEWTDFSEEDWTLQQKVDAQLEILGVGVAAHPLELISDKLAGT